MKLEIKSAKVVGSCNYCTKGKLSKDGMGLDFPYEKVVYIKGNNISTRACFECYRKIVRFDEFVEE